MGLLPAALVIFGLLVTPAQAGKKTAQQAEVRRLYEDANRLMDRGAWTGVERAYLQMLTLERRGSDLTHDHHLIGAKASQNLGDPYATWERLGRAQKIESRLDTLTELATIEATYSRFQIEIHPSFDGEITLTSIDPVFDPLHRATLENAQEALAENRFLDGLLPLGRYELAGQLTLESYGGERQKVVLRSDRVTVVDPSDSLDIDLPDPDALGKELSVVARGDLEAKQWSKLAADLQQKLLALEGVDAVQVIPVPQNQIMADFNPDSLAGLGLSGEVLAEAVRTGHGLGADQITIGPRQLVLAPGAVKSTSELDATEISVEGIVITLDTLARTREGPPPSASAAGPFRSRVLAKWMSRARQSITKAAMPSRALSSSAFRNRWVVKGSLGRPPSPASGQAQASHSAAAIWPSEPSTCTSICA